MSNAKQLDFSDISGFALHLPDADRLCSLAPQTESEIVRIGVLVDRFVEHSRACGADGRPRKKPTTLTAYEKWRRGAERVGKIDGVAVLEQDARLATPGWCQKVHDAVTERSGPAQADNVAKLMQAAWQHAEERGESLRANPWKGVKRNGSKPPPIIFPRGWTLDFLNLLEDASRDGVLPPKIADMFTVGQLLGGRMWCEIRRMRWEDLRKDEGIIVFPWSKEEIRAVPIELLGERGSKAIARQSGKSDTWIWAGKRGPVGETTAAKWWPAVREYAAERGLMFHTLDGKPLVIHHLRHAFTDYCRSVLKLPSHVVQQLLGHKDERSTRRYTHWSPEHLRDSARLVADNLGGRTVAEAVVKPPGLNKDRIALAIKHIGGDRKLAEIDEHIAARINKAQGKVSVKARAVAGWRQRQRTPSDDVVDLIAQWISQSVGWSESTALGWLFGYGGDELPPPPQRLRLASSN